MKPLAFKKSRRAALQRREPSRHQIPPPFRFIDCQTFSRAPPGLFFDSLRWSTIRTVSPALAP